LAVLETCFAKQSLVTYTFTAKDVAPLRGTLMIRCIAVTGLILCTVAAPAQPPTSQSKVTKIVGGTFDPAYQEEAPEGGLLIGFKMSLGRFVDRDVIRSLRPIFRTAEGKETEGKQYGVPEGKVYVAKAKAGYAVGGVKIRTGLLIDGMSVIFMKTNDNALDRNDAYETVWIGNDIGGSPSILAGDGTPVVGFAAKVTANNQQCSGLGLILRDSPGETSETSVNVTRLTRSNFDRIQNGMTENQVTAILGPPDSSSQRAAKVLTWRQIDRNHDGNLATTVTVTLRRGKVAGKNWQEINFSKR
jgi:hypothetical protein